MVKKYKYLTLFIIVIYVSGFISGRLIKPFNDKDLKQTEIVVDKIDLQENYKKESQLYIDSANNEMFYFSMKYHYVTPNLLPNSYTSYSGDVIPFNKENFFHYYSMYKITDYLSKAKTIMINGLLLDSKDTTLLKF
jgi:hypothetical protein